VDQWHYGINEGDEPGDEGQIRSPSAAMLQDFAPIRADYAFFEEHSTEAEEDVRAYLPHLQALSASVQSVRMLDLGGGEGRFSAQFLTALRIPAEHLQLSLVEPVEVYRQQAAERLHEFSTLPVRLWPAMPPDLHGCFDLVLANHSLYYVPDLDTTVSSLLRSLSSPGLFLCALAGQENLLIQFWNHCFGLIGKAVPYHTAEDLKSVLLKEGVAHRTEKVTYDLAFPDSEENRLHIMRFLLGGYFEAIPRAEMLAAFDRYRAAGRIAMCISHQHFIIWKNQTSLPIKSGQPPVNEREDHQHAKRF
jgi:SAM-dependent methyltransferase